LTSQSFQVETLSFLRFPVSVATIFHLQMEPKQRMTLVRRWHRTSKKFVKLLKSCSDATIFYSIVYGAYCLIVFPFIHMVSLFLNMWHALQWQNFSWRHYALQSGPMLCTVAEGSYFRMDL